MVNQEYESYHTDLGIKYVKDNAGSLFEETTMSPSLPATYQVSLQWTDQLSISVKEDITIYGCGSPLDHSKELCSPVSYVFDKNSDL